MILPEHDGTTQPPKQMIKLTYTQKRSVTIQPRIARFVGDDWQHEIDSEGRTKTIEVERTQVLFKGSPAAFEIWKATHRIPPGARYWGRGVATITDRATGELKQVSVWAEGATL